MADAITPAERDALAAELALGVLDGDARAYAMRLRLSDRDFAVAVEEWRDRLAPLYDAFEEAAPPALWPAIEARLGDVAAGGQVVRLQRRLAIWRAATAGSAAVAAILLAVVVMRPASEPVGVTPPQSQPQPQPQPAVIAQLSDAEGDALLAARYAREPGVLMVRSIRLPASDLVPELWVISADGKPRSLGLFDADGISRVVVAPSNRAFMRDGATLAVTFEVREGAPHAAPSMPIIATGTIATI